MLFFLKKGMECLLIAFSSNPPSFYKHGIPDFHRFYSNHDYFDSKSLKTDIGKAKLCWSSEVLMLKPKTVT